MEREGEREGWREREGGRDGERGREGGRDGGEIHQGRSPYSFTQSCAVLTGLANLAKHNYVHTSSVDYFENEMLTLRSAYID